MRTSSEAGRVLARGLGKRYAVIHERPRLLGLSFLRVREFLWALRHLDLDLSPGDSLGVIGPNGSGKSTLLRVLSGVTAPTEGQVEVGGRISSLITVGAGFHEELTGRENVFVGGAVLGMPREEIRRRFDDIVSFSGLTAAIDRPVKHYSSGMFMRLGFSLAIFARPDVLLVDEVLAVGDAAFRARCYERVDQLRADGVTLVFVSHAMPSVERLCPHALVLSRGEAAFQGEVREAVGRYLALIDAPGDGGAGGFEVDSEVLRVAGGASAGEIELFGPDGAPDNRFPVGAEVTVRFRIAFAQEVGRAAIAIGILAGPDTVYVLPCGDAEGVRAGEAVDGDVALRLHLSPGTYRVVVTALSREEDRLLVRRRSDPFFVAATDEVLGWGTADLEGRPRLRRSYGLDAAAEG